MRSMPGDALTTYADLESFPDDGFRREIIDGELIVSPSPKVRHQELLARLFLVFGNHIAAHGGGKVYFAPLDVLFSDIDVVEPDLLFISQERLDVLTEKNVQGTPPD
jgi:Uma2 family endonuclease